MSVHTEFSLGTWWAWDPDSSLPYVGEGPTEEAAIKDLERQEQEDNSDDG